MTDRLIFYDNLQVYLNRHSRLRFPFRSVCGQKRGSLPSWEGARNRLQQDALHLQVVENFFAIFLIVISFTSFQHRAGITLKKIRL